MEIFSIFLIKIEDFEMRFVEEDLQYSLWDLVVARFERHFSGWKVDYLLKEGRLAVLKSTISSLLVYYLSCAKKNSGYLLPLLFR